MRLSHRAGLLAAAAILAGCSEDFSPIEPSPIRYSIYGFLNVSADTQWIRVTPIRDVQTTAPEPLGVRVTLERIGTQQVIELHDSLFRFPADPDVGSEGVYLHNFWTTEHIQAGASYRLRVTDDAGPTAETIVLTPPDYDLEVWVGQRGQGTQLRIAGVEHVAFIDLLTTVRDGCTRELPAVLPMIVTVPSTNDDVRYARIPGAAPLRPGCVPVDVLHQDLAVAAAGAKWPSDRTGSANLGPPGEGSEISGSVGFLGGVMIKGIPLELCRQEGVEFCRLRYDPGWAAIEGSLTDNRCGVITSVRGATVELRELEPEEPFAPRVRYVLSRMGGQYLIRGVVPGERYALRVSRPSAIPTEHFLEHHDTLTFTPGQRMRYDVALQRAACP